MRLTPKAPHGPDKESEHKERMAGEQRGKERKENSKGRQTVACIASSGELQC